jgi:hypothetical protein
MKRFSGILVAFVAIVTFAGISITSVVGCGGGSSPTPTPTPSTVFPNNTATAQSPPIKLGTSGGNANDFGPKFCCIGTLGSLWTRADLANPVILSNNHVLAESDNGKAAPGDPIIQPLQLVCNGGTPSTVAQLTEAVPLKPVANVAGACGNPAPSPLCGPAPKNVDAAIAEINTGQVDTSGMILDLGAVGASSIAPAPPSSTVATPALGQAVGKVGRTTGLTCSTIAAFQDVQVDYDASCGGAKAFTAIFRNQLVIAGGNFSANGDSGSLIVTTDTARPVGLLYGGGTTSTVANPIQDVISALTTPPTATPPNAAPTIIGGPDHAVSCARTANATSAQIGTAQSALVPQERQRVSAVQKARAQSLMRDLGATSVEVGSSADNPGEGALVLHFSGKSIPAVPATIDGVRTRLVFDDPNVHLPAISAQQLSQAKSVKEAHVSEFLGKPGIQGFGISISADNPTEIAISFSLVQGEAHPPIPATIDGLRTRIFEGTRFHAY